MAKQTVEVSIQHDDANRSFGQVTVEGAPALVQEAVDRIRKGNPPPKKEQH